ncbi:TadE/TadG family type IV pilus assembly protein [Parerythrobacter aurantius]|uniref:TadE/TadG family type IV pilus assembly protein n=1 Tax=Parerythrobacter aurantius TaxID=3127706 RepID=UPI0032527044
MIRAIRKFVLGTEGAAAAEMALMLPLLTIIMFGGMEMGGYFWSEHQVIKSVRNGTRFAARQDFSNFVCGASTVGAKDAAVRNFVRTGTVDGTGNPVVRTWTAANDGITISVNCKTGQDFTNGGIYSDQSGAAASTIDSARNVMISVSLPYPSLFGNLGYLNGRNIRAFAQSPVTGF